MTAPRSVVLLLLPVLCSTEHRPLAQKPLVHSWALMRTRSMLFCKDLEYIGYISKGLEETLDLVSFDSLTHYSFQQHAFS